MDRRTTTALKAARPTSNNAANAVHATVTAVIAVNAARAKAMLTLQRPPCRMPTPLRASHLPQRQRKKRLHAAATSTHPRQNLLRQLRLLWLLRW